MPKNWEQREKKLDKRRNGMRVSGKSIFVIEEADAKRNKEKVRKFEDKKGKR